MLTSASAQPEIDAVVAGGSAAARRLTDADSGSGGDDRW
ncbi:hypothetical protein Halru_0639 [Halovivax ruber XH-70]|uniref:Uncharacterized protein n=1 Tax=Halovivax ruber (strain DSM 18193 / JCM 13892 / XH-70) TaxID=797302 RepID=L0IAK2_HALRX|nr:hypothetical protein Halru_0639 [Halovivax ruber XH-70]